MNAQASDGPFASAPSRWSAVWAAGALAAAGLAAYGGGLAGPFVGDDRGTIAENLSLRHWAQALFPPPGGLPVSGRPIVNLSFALNYAISGTNVWSYHALNLAIHVLAALALFGIARRTRIPTWPSFLIALLWTVHPLQTESVEYLSQRAESLMGLFYLLTLYGFLRGVECGNAARPAGGGAGAWFGVSWLACLLGMATKEVMVTAPVMVFLYDRTFLAGTFRSAWRRRRRLYLALSSTWILLAYLVAGTSGRGGTAGFGTSVPWWAYAFTQFRAVAHYLRLSVWPHPLVFDYGLILGGPPLLMAWDIAVVAALGVASAIFLRRRPPLGFLGAWFLVILAPSSSVVPVVTEIMAEHRAYLSLAAVMAGVVCGGFAVAQGLVSRFGGRPRIAAGACLGIGLAAATLLGAATARRNEVYQSVLAFWSDAVMKAPASAGARNNFGNVLAERGSLAEAAGQYRAALALAPDYDDAHYNLGNVLAREGLLAEAISHYRTALKFRAGDAAVHYALGSALQRSGEAEDAREQYAEALAAKSNTPGVWYNLGNALLEGGQPSEAARAYAEALRLRPDYGDALVNYASVLAQLGRTGDAVREFQAALRLQPDAADVHNNFGGLLAEAGRLAEAKEQFEEALRLKPDYREAQDNLRRLEAMERPGAGP